MTDYIVVDDQDNELGSRPFEELVKGTFHRTSALWLENTRGEVLIAKRGPKMATQPNKWSFSAAGRVEPGETYESNVLKEAKEEIGLSEIVPVFVLKQFVDSQRPHFCTIFKAVKDVPMDSLVLHPIEVAEVRWISKKELRDWVAREPVAFTQSFLRFANQLNS